MQALLSFEEVSQDLCHASYMFSSGKNPTIHIHTLFICRMSVLHIEPKTNLTRHFNFCENNKQTNKKLSRIFKIICENIISMLTLPEEEVSEKKKCWRRAGEEKKCLFSFKNHIATVLLSEVVTQEEIIFHDIFFLISEARLYLYFLNTK